MEILEQRLEVLERQFRRTQRVNGALACALVALVCVAAQKNPPTDFSPSARSKAGIPGQTPDKSGRDEPGRERTRTDRLRTIEADQFVLLDRQGRTRATLVVNHDGPALSMFDEDGRKRLELGHAEDASGLRVLDANEALVASLVVPDDAAEAKLEFRGPNGRATTSAAGLSVVDRTNQGRLLLALINGNFPVLSLSQSGQTGCGSVEITAGNDGGRGLKMHNAAGASLFSVHVAKTGATYVSLRHPDHERSLQISSGPNEEDGPRLNFFAPGNPDGSGGIGSPLQLGFQEDGQPSLRVSDRDGRLQIFAPKK